MASFLDQPGTGGGILPPYGEGMPVKQNPGGGGSVPSILPPITGQIGTPTHATQNPGATTPPQNGPQPTGVPAQQVSVLGPIDDCQRSVSVAVFAYVSYLNPPPLSGTVSVYVNGRLRGNGPIPILPIAPLPQPSPAIPFPTVAEVPIAGCCLKIGDVVTASANLGGGTITSPGVTVESHEKYSYLTQQYNMQRTGWYPYETQLNPGIDWSKFGVKHKIPVDGKVFAQPLYLHHQYFPFTQSAHNVLFIATDNDSLYAFDADTGQKLWQRNLLFDGERTVVSSDVGNCGDFVQIGVYSTPVIDCGCRNVCQCKDHSGCGCNASCQTPTIYVVSKSVSDSDSTFHSYLHAIDAITGLERPNSPVDITVPGFDAQNLYNRIGLLLLNGVIYIGFAGHCSTTHGWIISYDAQTLVQKNSFNTTPNSNAGGVWQSNTGLASDGVYIYCTTGDSTDQTFGNNDFGCSVLKLSPELKLLSFFAPNDAIYESKRDLDLASGGILIPPDPQRGDHANLLITCGKAGEIYVLDRNRLGGHSTIDEATPPTDPPINPPNKANNPAAVSVKKLQPNATRNNGDSSPGPWGGPAYFNNGAQLVYYIGNGWSDAPLGLQAFIFSNGFLAQVDVSTETFPVMGSTPIISSDGNSNGIAWAIDRQPPLTLHAYDATNLSNTLHPPGGWQFGPWTSPPRAFIEPTVINGKVYVASDGVVSILY